MKKILFLVISLGTAFLFGNLAFAGPIITDVVPSEGCYGGSFIEVAGSGFGNERSSMIDGENGYHSVVSFSYDSDPGPHPIIATEYRLWSDVQAGFIFTRLFVDDNDNYIKDGGEGFVTGLDAGDYSVVVYTVAFQDTNPNGMYDSGDTFSEDDVTSSNVATFNVAQPAVSVSLSPSATNFMGGDYLGFEATLTNDSDITTIVFFATKLVFPSGASGYMISPRKVTLDGSQSKSANLGHQIPTIALFGPYQYYAAVILYGVGIIDMHHFDFQVGQTSDGGCDSCHSGSAHHGGTSSDSCFMCHSGSSGIHGGAHSGVACVQCH